MSFYPCDWCGWMPPSCTCQRSSDPRCARDVQQRHKAAVDRAWRSGWAAQRAVARAWQRVAA